MALAFRARVELLARTEVGGGGSAGGTVTATSVAGVGYLAKWLAGSS
jgi:hypothetical protein